MMDVWGNVIGFRLRLEDGKKLSIRGGRAGLFVPSKLAGADMGRLMVTEGPTDCAALLDLGFEAVGRPSCTGGVSLLAELVRRYRPGEVVIVSDADTPGRRGAESLATALLPYVRALRVICPPAGIKDAREWKRAGVTPAELLDVVQAAGIRRLDIRGRLAGEGGAA